MSKWWDITLDSNMVATVSRKDGAWGGSYPHAIRRDGTWVWKTPRGVFAGDLVIDPTITLALEEAYARKITELILEE